MQQYKIPRCFAVTKEFVSGWMRGIIYTEITQVEFEVGKTYEPCAGDSKYVVLSCREVH